MASAAVNSDACCDPYEAFISPKLQSGVGSRMASSEEGERERLLAEFEERLPGFYPDSRTGGLLFQVLRVFVVAYSGRPRGSPERSRNLR